MCWLGLFPQPLLPSLSILGFFFSHWLRSWGPHAVQGYWENVSVSSSLADGDKLFPCLSGAQADHPQPTQLRRAVSKGMHYSSFLTPTLRLVTGLFQARWSALLKVGLLTVKASTVHIWMPIHLFHSLFAPRNWWLRCRVLAGQQYHFVVEVQRKLRPEAFLTVFSQLWIIIALPLELSTIFNIGVNHSV